jgi:RNA polymerase sigma factor (sigma-70 family)
MSPDGSVTFWLDRFLAGDRDAVQQLWRRYFHRMVGLARQKLGGLPKGAADEEDVALSAFASFCRRAEQGLFPELDDRDDLWQVLLMLTARKVCDLARHERRARRDWKRTRPLDAEADREPPGAAPDPAMLAEVEEESRRLLALLPDDHLRAIALHKLDARTNEEIADLLGCSLATVERRLKLIRKYWGRELPPCGVPDPEGE